MQHEMIPLSPCCKAAIVYIREPRCSGCGHRQAVNGVKPVETQEKPPWARPLEIFDRILARGIRK